LRIIEAQSRRKMKYATKVVLCIAVLMLAAALAEAQGSEPENPLKMKMRKRRWFGFRKALPEEAKQETQFDMPGLMICLSGFLIAGVGASLIAKKAEVFCQVSHNLY